MLDLNLARLPLEEARLTPGHDELDVGAAYLLLFSQPLSASAG
jgi:hypothetical protein